MYGQLIENIAGYKKPFPHNTLTSLSYLLLACAESG